jgi:hypothetical protein
MSHDISRSIHLLSFSFDMFLPVNFYPSGVPGILPRIAQGSACSGYRLAGIQQEEDSLHQQIRLRAKKEISKVLHLVRKLGLFGN